VPPSQGREFYYALKRLGVPTRLLTYESNAHAIVKVRP
jgi:dipeptidyl aminopeptidase/acylaminoacyl peptidase